MKIDVWVDKPPKVGDEVLFVERIDGKGNATHKKYVIIQVYGQIGDVGEWQVWEVEVEPMDGSLKQI